MTEMIELAAITGAAVTASRTPRAIRRSTKRVQVKRYVSENPVKIIDWDSDDFSKADLVEFCKQHNLKTTGSKSVLVGRLKAL